MGIPSYFRRIIQKYPGIVKTSSDAASAICFDFNCLIYRCMRSPTLIKTDDTELWESLLIEEVCKTVKEIWRIAGKPKQVYLAIDGVVPMAKIRQQRVRRFKSAWLRKESCSSSWDSNAITPGTRFMAKLGKELEALCSSKKGWSVSGVDQEGEGEHKIMKWLRERDEKGGVVIYGLDADLILLSMLTGEMIERDIVLLREKQEFGGTVSQGEQEYSFMDIQEFKIRLDIKGIVEVTNYVALMSLMGNDFLPHSITHKLNDDGHDYIMREVRAMKQGRGWLINDAGKVSREVLLDVCKRWCVDEEERMLHCIQKKNEQAQRGVAKGMDASEGLPLEWKIERNMTNGKTMALNWRSQYWAFIHPQADKSVICSEYVYGVQWIIDYYTGKPVNLHWVFPSWIPPLWTDLAEWLAKKEFPKRAEMYNAPIKPEEQLTMVLPLESWNLIENKNLKMVPLLAPQMWPKKFPFFSFGRRWLWECEARIPVLTAERLHEILNDLTIDGECAGKNS